MEDFECLGKGAEDLAKIGVAEFEKIIGAEEADNIVQNENTFHIAERVRLGLEPMFGRIGGHAHELVNVFGVVTQREHELGHSHQVRGRGHRAASGDDFDHPPGIIDARLQVGV